MYKQTLTLLSVLLFVGCQTKETISDFDAIPVSVAGETADHLQMLETESGNLLIWWLEKNDPDGKNVVKMSEYSASAGTFSQSVVIHETKGVNPGHGEAIPKLVIKPDGTMILVFARPNEDAEYRFASSVLYTQSFDGGETWTKARLIHSDTNPENGHGFPEAVLLPDGEVAAIWLDGRHKLEHSVMYFAKTNDRNGFGEDKPIGGPVCQCCKNDMHVDENGKLHVVYRSLLEGDIRDIMHMTSDDFGITFSRPVRVNKDNWGIDACPHNGPSVAENEQGLHFFWYSLGGGEGLFYTNSRQNGYGERVPVTKNLTAKHPYIQTMDSGIFMIWDELATDRQNNSYRRIKTALLNPENRLKTTYLSPPGVKAVHPYMLKTTDNSLWIAWTQSHENRNTLFLKEAGAVSEPADEIARAVITN